MAARRFESAHEAEVWVRLAAAAMLRNGVTHQAAESADEMLEEYRRRLPGRPPATAAPAGAR